MVDNRGMEAALDASHVDHPVRRRLWKVGGLMAAFLLAVGVGNFFLPADKAFDSRMYGHDFLPFYTAGQFVRMGRVDQLYDPAATRVLEHATCGQAGLVIHNEYGAFLNPPFVALPAAALAGWPYRTALAIWTGILAMFLTAAVVLLIRMFPRQSGWRTWGLAPLLLFTALPAWQAAIHAQNTFFSLLVLAGAVALWRSQKPFAAALVGGLLLFKPQLGAVLAAVLIGTQGRRALAGVAVSAMALLLVTLLATPGSMADYLHRMPRNLAAIQVLPNYTWNRHVTFLAFWRMLLQGHVGAVPSALARTLSLCCMAVIAGGMVMAVVAYRRDRRRTDRLIAATIVSIPLLMPYYMDYDMTLLSVAAVLCAVDAIRYGYDRSVLLAWVALYIAMEFNAAISGSTSVIPAVPFLAMLSIRLLSRVREPIEVAARIPAPTINHPWAVAA
jgi:hypothetical protein